MVYRTLVQRRFLLLWGAEEKPTSPRGLHGFVDLHGVALQIRTRTQGELRPPVLTVLRIAPPSTCMGGCATGSSSRKKSSDAVRGAGLYHMVYVRANPQLSTGTGHSLCESTLSLLRLRRKPNSAS